MHARAAGTHHVLGHLSVLKVAAGLAVGVLPVLASAGLLEHLNRIVVVGLVGPEEGAAPVGGAHQRGRLVRVEDTLQLLVLVLGDQVVQPATHVADKRRRRAW